MLDKADNIVGKLGLDSAGNIDGHRYLTHVSTVAVTANFHETYILPRKGIEKRHKMELCNLHVARS